MIKRIKGSFKSGKVRRLIDDSHYRTVVFACGSLIINIAYAVFNGISGIKYRSFWYITLFAYYIGLSLMRFYVVTYELKGSEKRTEKSVMRFCGLWLCALAAVVSGMVSLNIKYQRDTARPMVIMIVIATYTFWKTITAAINIFKAQKTKNNTLIALRNINCADAAVSLLSLEHAMISTFGSGSTHYLATMDGAVGAGVFIVVFAIGLSMVIKK